MPRSLKIPFVNGYSLERSAIKDGVPITEYYTPTQWSECRCARERFMSFEEVMEVYERYNNPTERASGARIIAY